MLLNKKLVYSNIRRYLSNQVNETLKSISEELTYCYNVQASLGQFIFSELYKLFNNIQSIYEDVADAISISNNY